MPERLWRLYRRRRVVNINANIIVGSLAAIGLAIIPVHFAKYATSSELILTIIAGASDIVFDVLIYYVLHWVANHWRRKKPLPEGKSARLEFFKDATFIQFERAILSPLYYLIAGGLTYSCMRYAGLMPEVATFIGFVGAIIVTRIIHTIWGLRSGTFRDTHHHEEAPAKPSKRDRNSNAVAP